MKMCQIKFEVITLGIISGTDPQNNNKNEPSATLNPFFTDNLALDQKILP